VKAPLPSTQVARDLTETIAAMDRARLGNDDAAYRAASARAFRLALAMTEARTFREVVERLSR